MKLPRGSFLLPPVPMLATAVPVEDDLLLTCVDVVVGVGGGGRGGGKITGADEGIEGGGGERR